MQALVDEPCLIHKTCEGIVGSKDMSRCQSLVLTQTPRVQLVYRYHSFNLFEIVFYIIKVNAERHALEQDRTARGNAESRIIMAIPILTPGSA